MSPPLEIAIQLALTAPLAAATLAMAKAAYVQPVSRLHHDGAIYALGAFVTSWTMVIMIYTLAVTGPGIIAGIHLTLGGLSAFRLLETFREYVPLGWPWGYTGG